MIHASKTIQFSTRRHSRAANNSREKDAPLGYINWLVDYIN
jgi:hypothetical protein